MRTDTQATAIDPTTQRLTVRTPDGATEQLAYDELIIGTGARSVTPPIKGLTGENRLDASDGLHLLHSMADTFALMDTVHARQPSTAVIIGAGYIGLEMAAQAWTREHRSTPSLPLASTVRAAAVPSSVTTP